MRRVGGSQGSPAVLVALALLASASPARAQFRIELTDANVAAQGGDDFLLRQNITIKLFNDVAIQRELMRAGLEQGCLLLDSARDRVVAEHRSAFRTHLIAAMRSVVPPDEMATSSGLIVGDLGRYKGRVTEELGRTASAIYDRGAAEARTLVTSELAAAPTAAPGTAAGRLADWRLDTAFSLEIACSLIASRGTPQNFANRKIAFDRFFRRQGE